MNARHRGIPEDHPVRVVREDPNREGLLYAGTEFGIFISFDDGKNWQSFQLNLPATPVTDIKVVGKDLALSTMGRSFWIMYNLSPLHEFSAQTAEAEAHLFQVNDPYRLRGSGRRSRDSSGPQYPQPGAYIDYYLGNKPDGDIKLEILDSQGKLIRLFSSGSITVAEEAKMDEWHLEGAGTSRLPKSAGIHRFIWDLRYPGPWDANASRSGRSGPMVPPGEYQARLTVGDWNDTAVFKVKMDPRVAKEGITKADVTAQAEFALEVRDTFSNTRLAVVNLNKAIKEKGEKNKILAEIKKQLITEPVRYSRPMLADQISYLYSSLNRADQKPSLDAINRHEELKRWIQEQIQTLDRF